MSKWVAISKPPKRTGKYLIGHRGHQEMAYFFAQDTEWHPTAKMGWQHDLSFRPTHWMKIPQIRLR